MEISKEQRGRAVVLRPTGEVDMHAAPRLRSEMMECAAEKVPVLIVDMGGVGYIDSSGLAVLIEYLKESAGFGGKIVLFGLGANVRDVFALVRLDGFFTIVGDEAAALAAAGV